MLQIDNHTAWPIAIFPNSNGQWTGLCKTSFSYASGRVTLLDSPQPIEPADQYVTPNNDEQNSHTSNGITPAQAMLSVAGEYVPNKAKAEVLMSGTAYPPADAKPGVTDVRIQISKPEYDMWHKTIQVYGQRYWQLATKSKTTKSNTTRSSSRRSQKRKPNFAEAESQYEMRTEPLTEPLPITYQHSASSIPDDNGFSDNPVGIQSLAAQLQAQAKVQAQAQEDANELPNTIPAPRIVYNPQLPSKPIKPAKPASPKPAGIVAGFGPIAPHWLPRVSTQLSLQELTETQAETSNSEDLAAIHNQAPTDQQLAYYFEGGESIELTGLTPESTTNQWMLPMVTIVANLVLADGQRTALTFTCDTLNIDADEQTFSLIHRSPIPVSPTAMAKHWLEVTAVTIQPIQAPDNH